ncbi:MAG: hypothetical protein KUG79_05920 [Pseudomonadales bacterium]|nr:hypothetical protein [Pseudomonadales bacterium]
MANSLGMPDIPRIRLPHPVSGTGNSNMREVAKAVLPQILTALKGN